MGEENRIFTSRRRLDLGLDPPEFVDDILPTTSLTFRGPERRGVERAPHGTQRGSYRVTGTFYENAPGTYSLRITRLSVFSGSREALWSLEHSRQGTIDIIHWESPGQEYRQGDPLRPLYSLGPGTISWGFIGDISGRIGSGYNMGQFMSGV